MHARNSLAVLAVLCVAAAAVAQCGSGQECDHQAHAVAGKDVTVFDVKDEGFVSVKLDGSLSHSHYFQAGPPIKNGEIVSYVWTRVGDEEVICREEKCESGFGVGVTEVTLTVCDQTGDCASDDITVSVEGVEAELGSPDIKGLQPSSGGAGGGNKVTINGINFAGEPTVEFGGVEATNVLVVSPSQITVTAPPGIPGGVAVVVKTVKGKGKGADYVYDGGSTNVDWEEDVWKNPDGSVWRDAKEVSGITLGPNGVYYLSSLVGNVWAVTVDADNVVTSACSGAQFEDRRSLYGVAWNPVDETPRLLVTSNTMFWGNTGATWNNGKVEFVNIETDGCVSKGGVLIDGLPVSNHDHGVNKMTFDNEGGLYITVGGATNAGVAFEKFGGIDESPLSGAVLYAPYLSGNFNGNVKYTSDDPGTCRVSSGDVSVFAPGVRNSFGITTSSDGVLYATDNGPNSDFGPKSTGPKSQEDDPSTQDALYRIEKDAYYGHPNRNRGRDDPRQNVFQSNWEKAMGTVPSSTNGIVEYTANTFNGAIKGDLFLSKLSWRGKGAVFHRVITGNDNVFSDPYEAWGNSGNQIIQSPQGYLVMPKLKDYSVLVLKPKTVASRMLTLPGDVVRPAVYAIFPEKGHWHGGYRMTVTGSGFGEDSTVAIGSAQCEDFLFHSETEVSCEVPAGRGTAHVVVKTGAGVTSTFYGTHDFRWL